VIPPRVSAVPHKPVMVAEVLKHLITNRAGRYVDGTFGLGGHSSALARELGERAILIGIDQDQSALETFDHSRIPQVHHLIHDNFEHLDQILADLGIRVVDGILLDLGLNSFSLDDPKRGFSFSHEGPLDMRFDQAATHILTAAQLLNQKPEKHLADLFYEYGEERQSRRIAREIVRLRALESIETTQQLRSVITRCTHPNLRVKTLARIFQALRIAVNRELEVLERILELSLDSLATGGRIAVISYHSLEDRMVKRFFRDHAQDIPQQPGMRPDEVRVPSLKVITRKPLKATEEEVAENPRARSAMLRVAERVRNAAE